MKINFDFNQITELIKKNLRTILYLFSFLVILLIGYEVYLLLTPVEDQDVKSQIETDIHKLNYSFDKKTIQIIEQKTAPTTVSQPGGRNPFLPF